VIASEVRKDVIL